ncbi:MAG: hypothetical protein NWF04_05280 [Candidatus Bathyarchaeota archaeon]|nr:hypothetical protein [Candidatus Bathyarchaeota archaeon]
MASWSEYFSMKAFRALRRLGIQKLLQLRKPMHKFTDCFLGFEDVEAVKELFGDQTKQVLEKLQVEFIWFGYMGVDNKDGHLMVNTRYLKEGDKTEIYLDIIHELCHVKQHMQGKDLFDPRYSYVDRPTEIQAYTHAVKEARRIGWSDQKICQYLKTEWITPSDLKRLANHVGVKC